MRAPGEADLANALVGIARETRLPDLLRRVLHSARDLLSAPYGALQIPPQGHDTTTAERIQLGVPEAHHELVGELPTGRGTAASRPFLGIPIMVGEAGYATLYLAGPVGGTPFADHDEEILRTLVTAAEVAIDNVTRFERTRRREQWLRAAQDVTSALLSGAAPVDTLRLVAERARSVSAAAVTAIAVPVDDDPSRLIYEVVDGIGTHPDPFTGRTMLVDNTSSGRALVTGKPVATRHIGPRILSWAERGGLVVSPDLRQLDSTVFAPLLVGDRVIGVLVVSRLADDPPFDSAEIDLVRTFAGQAALVLEFARAKEDRERLAVLSDRERIARDLHDLVIQRLFGVGLGLQGLRRQVTGPAGDRIAGLVQDIDRTIKEVRTAIFSLQDTSPGLTGVRSELLRLAHEAAAMLGVEPRVSFDGPLDSVVAGELRADLLATLRDALSTVAQHTGATEVHVDVVVDPRSSLVNLRVWDNGIPLAGEPDQRVGQENMADRAARWNGTLAIDDMPGGGTNVRWTVSLKPG